MYVAQPIEWSDRGVVMLDQSRLPAEEIRHTYTDYCEVARAIAEMVIRGAPAIGVALLTVVGLIFTYVRARTGTVLASYLLHLGYNSMIALTFAVVTKGFRHIPPGN